jgi:hypothetical protein
MLCRESLQTQTDHVPERALPLIKPYAPDVPHHLQHPLKNSNIETQEANYDQATYLHVALHPPSELANPL